MNRAWRSSILHKNFSGLQINDILFPLSFDLGEIGIFWRYFYCRWPEDQKMGSALMPIEGLFLLLASIQAQIIVKGIRRNETATIKTVRKKTLRHWCGWGDLVQLSLVKQNLLQQRVGKLLNEPPYGRQNQTKRRYMFRKTSAMKSWLTFAMIHSVEIALLFMSFKHLRLEREQIRQILLDWEQMTSDMSLTLEKLFLKWAEQDLRVKRRPC